jgi:hypothetical protein
LDREMRVYANEFCEQQSSLQRENSPWLKF